MATIDTVWRARDTKPGDIDAALRASLSQIHRDNAGYVPARVLNLVCIVDKEYSGEIANRLRRVGRYHPSRTIVCSVDPKRTTLDAVATIAAPSESSGPSSRTSPSSIPNTERPAAIEPCCGAKRTLASKRSSSQE